MIGLVYNIGSEKPSVTSEADILKSSSHKASGFFSPPSDGLEAFSTPQGTPAPAPVVHKESIHYLESNIVLTIFSANVDVHLDKKMAGELLRATKKNPLSRLCYELIYVSFTVLKDIQNRFLLLLRQGRTIMTQASRRRRKWPGVCFKGFGLTWKGLSHHSV